MFFSNLKIERINKFNNNINKKSLKTYKKNYNLRFIRSYKTNNKYIKKFNQISIGYGKLQEALDIYEKKSGLLFINKLSTVFMLAGFISWSLCLLKISILFSPFILACIANCEFIIGFILNLIVYIKRIYFIINYDLDCNPGVWAKALGLQTATTRFSTKSVVFFCGASVTFNYFISEVTGISPFAEYGKHCIYGDKTFVETTKIIYTKMKNGPESLD